MAVARSLPRCVHGVSDDVCWPCTYVGPVPIDHGTADGYWIVPRYLSGATVVCIGAGPSITKDDAAYALSHAPVVAAGDGYWYAPRAEVLHACDLRWWRKEYGARAFRGRFRTTLDATAAREFGLRLLETGPKFGLQVADPWAVAHGQSSGYQAVNLAVLMGAARVLLLGYDYQKSEHGEHYFHRDDRWRGTRNYGKMREAWPSMAEAARAVGVEIVNCSRRSVLECFPTRPLREVL